MTGISYRPRSTWTDPETKVRQRSPFQRNVRVDGQSWTSRRPVPFADTEYLLVREAKELGAKVVVVEVIAPPRAFRNDGLMRADARIDHPGVVVTLNDTRHGPLRYAADTFDKWQDNVRAVALALEALRKVDRYGVTKSGEQYRGWTALPAGSGVPMQGGVPMVGGRPAEQLPTEDEALDLLIDLAIGPEPEQYESIRVSLRRSPAELRRTIREAKLIAHPDRAGSRLKWNELERALRVLGAS